MRKLLIDWPYSSDKLRIIVSINYGHCFQLAAVLHAVVSICIMCEKHQIFLIKAPLPVQRPYRVGTAPGLGLGGGGVEREKEVVVCDKW